MKADYSALAELSDKLRLQTGSFIVATEFLKLIDAADEYYNNASKILSSTFEKINNRELELRLIIEKNSIEIEQISFELSKCGQKDKIRFELLKNRYDSKINEHSILEKQKNLLLEKRMFLSALQETLNPCEHFIDQAYSVLNQANDFNEKINSELTDFSVKLHILSKKMEESR